MYERKELDKWEEVEVVRFVSESLCLDHSHPLGLMTPFILQTLVVVTTAARLDGHTHLSAVSNVACLTSKNRWNSTHSHLRLMLVDVWTSYLRNHRLLHKQ